MLERFRQRYPVGSLTSELLTIDRGKYLVRVSIQVDGLLLGTGMGEGETIEQAEDRARLRAIAVLVLDAEMPAQSKPQTSLPQTPPKPRPVELPAPEPVAEQQEVAPPPLSKPRELDLPSPTPATEATIEPAITEPDKAEISLNSTNKSQKSQEMPQEDPATLAVEEPLPLISSKIDTVIQLGEPIDFSEIIAKSDMELKRLGWTSEQGRNYLLQTYGKRSRQLLSDEELIEFLQHLQSLSSP